MAGRANEWDLTATPQDSFDRNKLARTYVDGVDGHAAVDTLGVTGMAKAISQGNANAPRRGPKHCESGHIIGSVGEFCGFHASLFSELLCIGT